MMRSYTEEIAADVMAERYLIETGFKQLSCELCKGTGFNETLNALVEGKNLAKVSNLLAHVEAGQCNDCSGRGWKWVKMIQNADV